MTKLRYQNIIDKMNLEEKVALCSGANNWITKTFEQHGIPSIRMADGPHGLRKQKDDGDEPGEGKSIPATCFFYVDTNVKMLFIQHFLMDGI